MVNVNITMKNKNEEENMDFNIFLVPNEFLYFEALFRFLIVFGFHDGVLSMNF